MLEKCCSKYGHAAFRRKLSQAEPDMPSIFNPKALDRQTLKLGGALLIVYLV
jgi:hypothetical protein